MDKPTAAAVRDYVNNGGTSCPFCKGDNIEGGSFNVESGIAWQEISCPDCKAAWQDTYTLSGIAIIDESGNVEEYLDSEGLAT